jgi:uncharacterized YccA/Bax inhibitor family protein
MIFIIKVLSVMGALLFIIAGVTGKIQPFGYFIQHGIILRVFEVLLGMLLLYNVSRIK